MDTRESQGVDVDASSIVQQMRFVGDSPGVLKEINKELTAQLAAAQAQISTMEESSLVITLAGLRNDNKELHEKKADLESSLGFANTVLQEVQDTKAANVKYLSDELNDVREQLQSRDQALREAEALWDSQPKIPVGRLVQLSDDWRCARCYDLDFACIVLDNVCITPQCANCANQNEYCQFPLENGCYSILHPTLSEIAECYGEGWHDWPLALVNTNRPILRPSGYPKLKNLEALTRNEAMVPPTKTLDANAEDLCLRWDARDEE